MFERKILFIDRDGTLIKEPEDKQIDSLAKLSWMLGVFEGLALLQKSGYELVMVSNQDGLGTKSFSIEAFDIVQDKIIETLTGQSIRFTEILICPHFEEDACDCRKPQLGLIMPYLRDMTWSREHSYVIGDRETDIKLAENMGIKGLRISDEYTWRDIAETILTKPREATVNRVTKETNIAVAVNIDRYKAPRIKTGIGFYDHMLEQIAIHAGIDLYIDTQGDLCIDQHHSIEDTALVLGEAIKIALGDKRGIERFSFVLPMDEACASVALDLGGRDYFKFEGEFTRQDIGGMPTELVPHFFRSFSSALGATLHLKLTGDDTHHKIESAFKALGRVLKIAMRKTSDVIQSSKGVI